jgi:beta-mannosidase
VRRISLSDALWTIETIGDVSDVPASARGRSFPARVPGCMHSDLIRAGVIGHPNLVFNEEACQWIGRTDWRYRCQFEVDAATLAHDRIDLVLDGLDTVATIDVNGQRAGQAMNMHHAHRFNVKPMLRAGENQLTIDLRGPVVYVEEQEYRLGARPVNGDWTPYSYIRKMASNFQWDWGPRVATCGIWRGAWLEAWSGARIHAVRPIIVHADETQATIEVCVDIEQSEHGAKASEVVEAVICEISDDGSTSAPPQTIRRIIKVDSAHDDCVRLMMQIDRPVLWWPRGLGVPRLHGLQVSVNHGNRTIDQRNLAIGVRQSRLLTSPDEHGSAFTIEINGRPIFCKGANWIPESLFPEDQSPQRIRERVQQAADANFNMLRVWGGGTYEQEAFYDACDDLGIMVWQDFMFACATYPEDDPFPQLVEREAREAVSRLAHHASIVLWCGGNENVLGYESWGWKRRMPRHQKRGARYFFDILPRVVKELDPSRPYWPDSPHSNAQRTELHPNDPDHGDRHTWDAKVEGYRDLVPRFCSEFGHQSPPCWATMRETWGEDQLRLDSRAMIHRQRASGGNKAWYGRKVLGHRFRQPRDFDEWLYLAHLLQARAMSIGIEWMRVNRPRCMGALFWQFNDAWAGHSWACIDSAGRRKPAWHAIRRSFAPRLITIQPIKGALRACAVNDSAEAWHCRYRARRLSFQRGTLSETDNSMLVPSSGLAVSPALLEMTGGIADERDEFLAVDTGDAGRALWFFREDRDLLMPPARIDATAAMRAGACDLTIRAGGVVRDIILSVGYIDGRSQVDHNLVTLLPGESHTFRLSDMPKDAAWMERCMAPPVFRCANEFTASARQT